MSDSQYGHVEIGAGLSLELEQFYNYRKSLTFLEDKRSSPQMAIDCSQEV
jgi:hypothetical protein